LKEMTYRDALREALYEEMQRDSRVFVAGEDVGLYGGAYAGTKNLIKEFGPERRVDTPISEAGIVGLGVGAAITGVRPVIELMYVDFVGLAMDQICNQMAKWRYMSGGRMSVPMVLRMQGGTGRSAGAQHSQSLEAYLVHTPGLLVVMPATPADAKGLLKSAIRSDDPVVFIEHKALYAKKGPVPEGEYLVPIGSASILRQGKDVTVLTYSKMVYACLEAADMLASAGIDVEVIDLRSLKPLDMDTVSASAMKTGRVAVVYEAHKTVGMGAELGALIMERHFKTLKAPVLRIAGRDVPVPATNLEKYAIPDKDEIAESLRKLMKDTP